MTKPARTIPVYTVQPGNGGYAVHRDGSVLKTRAGTDFILPSEALAEALAEEWRAQRKKIEPASMPLTQLAATAIDIVRKNHDATVNQVSSYASGDLLCFRAENSEELAARQHEVWQPVLDWCALRFGANLRTGQGIMPIKQAPETLAAFRRAVGGCDDFILTGLKEAAEVSGSLVLALALAEKHLTAEQVFGAAELDALYQAKKWGDDPAAAKRHESIRSDLAVCEKWFALLG